MKGKGVPHLNGSGSGDQYITVNIETPKNLSNAQKDALRAYAAAMEEAVPEKKKSGFGKKKK